MSDIKAGAFYMGYPDLTSMLREQIGGAALLSEEENVLSLQVNRRRNPPLLQITTERGQWIREAQFSALARYLRLPPVHQVIDIWLDPRSHLVFFKVEGASLPVVPHGREVPIVQLVVEVKEAQPGQPSYVRSRFERTPAVASA